MSEVGWQPISRKSDVPTSGDRREVKFTHPLFRVTVMSVEGSTSLDLGLVGRK